MSWWASMLFTRCATLQYVQTQCSGKVSFRYPVLSVFCMSVHDALFCGWDTLYVKHHIHVLFPSFGCCSPWHCHFMLRFTCLYLIKKDVSVSYTYLLAFKMIVYLHLSRIHIKTSNHWNCSTEGYFIAVLHCVVFKSYWQVFNRFYRVMPCIRGTSHGPVSIHLSVHHKSVFY